MQFVNLLGAIDAQPDLDSFAMKFFSAIEMAEPEERESSSYVDGRYFKGVVDDISITVSLSDEENYEDLPFWIHIAADVLSQNALVDLVDRIVREKALPAGLRIARIVNLGKRDEQRIDY